VRSGAGEFPNVLFEITDKIVFYSLTKAVLNCSLVLRRAKRIKNPRVGWVRFAGCLDVLCRVQRRQESSFYQVICNNSPGNIEWFWSGSSAYLSSSTYYVYETAVAFRNRNPKDRVNSKESRLASCLLTTFKAKRTVVLTRFKVIWECL
jgi:hypothetical protein